jgi:hypothetical protein
MSPWMWFIGLFVVAAMAFLWPNPIIILILLLGALDVHRRWKTRHEMGEYYKVSKVNRALVAGVYIGLIVALAVGMDLTHLVRDLNDA